MNATQLLAVEHHCRLAGETIHPRFGRSLRIGMSVVLTVNSGYE